MQIKKGINTTEVYIAAKKKFKMKSIIKLTLKASICKVNNAL